VNQLLQAVGFKNKIITTLNHFKLC